MVVWLATDTRPSAAVIGVVPPRRYFEADLDEHEELYDGLATEQDAFDTWSQA